MSRKFSKGLHDLGNGCYAYLQPDGSWGLSNSGLVVDGDQALLVDTLIDLPLTAEMLATMRRNVPAAARIGTLINTHANPDHTYGNQLVSGAQIISSKACLDEMKLQKPPSAPDSFRKLWRQQGEAGAFFNEVMWTKFSDEGIVFTLPSRTFSGELELKVGRKTVRLIEVGPAHTAGDIIAYVPDDRTVFTGDIAFIDGHPIVWAGPMSNWIKACDLILGWDIDTVVPGHGPVTDKNGIRELRNYFTYVYTESRKRFDAGLSYEDAARDISLAAFADWLDPERIVINVYTCYREFSGETKPRDHVGLIGAMARLYFERKAKAGVHAH
jgi:cyclase